MITVNKLSGGYILITLTNYDYYILSDKKHQQHYASHTNPINEIPAEFKPHFQVSWTANIPTELDKPSTVGLNEQQAFSLAQAFFANRMDTWISYQNLTAEILENCGWKNYSTIPATKFLQNEAEALHHFQTIENSILMQIEKLNIDIEKKPEKTSPALLFLPQPTNNHPPIISPTPHHGQPHQLKFLGNGLTIESYNIADNLELMAKDFEINRQKSNASIDQEYYSTMERQLKARSNTF